MGLLEISVIIPTYNNLKLLKKTISCLEQQTVPPDQFEVIVIDDGSSDGTSTWLQNYHTSLNLKPVILSQNRGRSEARNAGLSKAAGSIVLLLDGDLEFGSELISRHAAHHRDKSDVIIGRIAYQPELGHRAYARFLETRGAMKSTFAQQVTGRYFLSGNSSLARSVVQQIGGFDTEIHYGEDIDFGLRLEQAGISLTYDPLLKVYHNHIRNLTEVLDNAREFGHSELPKLLAKHPELSGTFRIKWLNRRGIYTILVKIFVNSINYFLIKSLASVCSEIRVPAICYQYLLYYNYLQGLKAAGITRV